MSFHPVGSLYGQPAPASYHQAGSVYGAAPVSSVYGGVAPGVQHSMTTTQAVPHTTYGQASYTAAVPHSTTSYETVGYQPVIRTREHVQGLYKPPGKRHHAPWHKKYNFTERESVVEERPVQVPVTSTHTDLETRTVPTAATHVDQVTTTTTDWHPTA